MIFTNTKKLAGMWVVTLALAGCGNSAPPGGGIGNGEGTIVSSDLPIPRGNPTNRFELANGCMVVKSRATGRYWQAPASGGPVADVTDARQAAGFTMKATGLGRYAFYDARGRWLDAVSAADGAGGAAGGAGGTAGEQASGGADLLTLVGPLGPVADAGNQGSGTAGGSGGAVGAALPRSVTFSNSPSAGAEWSLEETGSGQPTGFFIRNTLTGQRLALGSGGDVFEFELAGSVCKPYPEVQLNARGTAFSGRNADGTVFGYAETHMHLGGSEALGGRIGYGSPFHKFGVVKALENCSEDHGPTGSLGVVDHLTGTGNPVGEHDVVGWPTFNDWPTYFSQGHHQTYYLWLKRAWLGGLRFMVNHLVANELLCQVWPHKQHDCNEMVSARLQRQLTLDLQDYIDAQEGGPGKGWFRIVYTPQEARSVIEAGKMAVVFGIESEKIIDCGEYLDVPECTPDQIDRRLDEWYGMGLRFAFPIHIFDNAFGGSEISRFTNDTALIQVYNAGNIAETGHAYATLPCEEADAQDVASAGSQDRDLFGLALLQVTHPPPFPGGCVKNARGLTTTGDYFIHALIDRGIIIETDHSGALSRKRMLRLAKERGVGVVSGHTGSVSPGRDSAGILETGGIISNLSDDETPVTIEFIQDLVAAYPRPELAATGLGSDINGIHAQPEPRTTAAENPLRYPFTSYDGRVVFDRQVSGQKVYDLNIHGVAHYGLYPDYLADMALQPGGREALQPVFRSAEAYLQLWENAYQKRLDTGRVP